MDRSIFMCYVFFFYVIVCAGVCSCSSCATYWIAKYPFYYQSEDILAGPQIYKDPFDGEDF